MRDLSLLPPLAPKGAAAEGYQPLTRQASRSDARCTSSKRSLVCRVKGQYLLDRGVPAGRLDALIPLSTCP